MNNDSVAAIARKDLSSKFIYTQENRLIRLNHKPQAHKPSGAAKPPHANNAKLFRYKDRAKTPETNRLSHTDEGSKS